MKKCENCGDPHKGNYGSGRFCSKKCLRSFPTKAKRKEINKRISKSLKGRKRTIFICDSCKKELDKNNKYCSECHKFSGNKTLFHKLNIFDTNLQEANKKAVDILYKEYFINKLSKGEIQDKYGILSNSLYYFFKKNDIKLRTLSESTSNALKKGKFDDIKISNQYKCGWHKTWDNRMIYYRSSYELDYAIELDKKKIKYYTEHFKIKYYDSQKEKERIAIPDFYIEKDNCLIEIKSNYTYDETNMRDKIKKYKELGYKVKLILEHKEIIC
jgi:hypothetical protein